MESYGAILKKAREDKMLDFETVERDTSITRQYLEALEAEDAGAFPGEPYLVGFLKNYADYLGVNKDEVVKLYHAKQIQESPVPEGLIVKQKPSFIRPLVIALSAVAVVIIAFCIYFFGFKLPQMKSEEANTIEQNVKVHQYELSSTGLTKRVYVGDQILVPSKDGKNKIVLTISNTLGSLTVATPVGNQILDLSEERELDVDGDGSPEMILYVSDISSTDAARGAEIRMLQKDVAPTEAPAVAVEEATPVDAAAAQTTPAKKVKQTQILEDNRAYPFTLNVSFRGACVFRYRVDHKETIEDYHESGDVVNVTGSNAIRLWMSNVNALKIQVIADTQTFDLEVGKAGQVQAEDIKWVKDGEGKYRLVVMELD